MHDYDLDVEYLVIVEAPFTTLRVHRTHDSFLANLCYDYYLNSPPIQETVLGEIVTATVLIGIGTPEFSRRHYFKSFKD